jgi:hypothetical protein
LIRRDSARPNSLDVNFTALNRRGTNEPSHQEANKATRRNSRGMVSWLTLNTAITFLQDATQRREHFYHIFSFTAMGNGSVNTFSLLGIRF